MTCLNPKLGWGHNLPFFGLWAYIIISMIFGRNWHLPNMNIERSLSKFRKSVEI